MRDETNSNQRRKPRVGEPVPFNIQVINSRVFVMYAISSVLLNEQGFIVDARQFLPSSEDSRDAAAKAKSGGFPNRGKLVEYNLQGELVQIYEALGRRSAPWGAAIAPATFGLLLKGL